MSNSTSNCKRFQWTGTSVLLFFGFLLSVGCKKSFQNTGVPNQELRLASNSGTSKLISGLPASNFTQVNLVANKNFYNASRTDPNLNTPWGLDFSGQGRMWIPVGGRRLVLSYDMEGNNVGLPVGTNELNTALVINPSERDFKLSNGAPASYIFASWRGVIGGWNPRAGDNTLPVKNSGSNTPYTGITIAKNRGSNFLYVVNYFGRKIDVFDNHFNPVRMSFSDPTIPAEFTPYNIKYMGGVLFVTYSELRLDGDERPSRFRDGFVNIFTTDGRLIKRFASGGTLYDPYGMAIATPDFFGINDKEGHNDEAAWDDNYDWNFDKEHKLDRVVILIANVRFCFINAFNGNGNYLGQLQRNGAPILIDGLKTISFPRSGKERNRLYFTSGPDEGKNGLIGYIIKN
jgi:uncharacterized protein (TIGR03118 family)